VVSGCPDFWFVDSNKHEGRRLGAANAQRCTKRCRRCHERADRQPETVADVDGRHDEEAAMVSDEITDARVTDVRTEADVVHVVSVRS
jgi:hypothetical protein